MRGKGDKNSTEDVIAMVCLPHNLQDILCVLQYTVQTPFLTCQGRQHLPILHRESWRILPFLMKVVSSLMLPA